MPADDNTRQADAEEGAPRSALLRELGQQSGVSSHPGGLLGHIGSEILNEKRRADRRLQEMVEGMIRLAEESSLDDQVRRVPLIAKVLIVGGVLTWSSQQACSRLWLRCLISVGFRFGANLFFGHFSLRCFLVSRYPFFRQPGRGKGGRSQ